MNDDASFVYGPRFFRPRAKIVGNVIEWKNPINTTAQIGITPAAKIAITAQTTDAPANALNNFGGAISVIIADPAKRSNTNPSRAHRSYSPAATSDVPGSVCS